MSRTIHCGLGSVQTISRLAVLDAFHARSGAAGYCTFRKHPAPELCAPHRSSKEFQRLSTP
jgi:hypothetical protein